MSLCCYPLQVRLSREKLVLWDEFMRDEVPSSGTNIAIENIDFILLNTIKRGGYFHGYVAMLVYRSVFFPVKPKIQLVRKVIHICWTKFLVKNGFMIPDLLGICMIRLLISGIIRWWPEDIEACSSAVKVKRPDSCQAPQLSGSLTPPENLVHCFLPTIRNFPNVPPFKKKNKHHVFGLQKKSHGKFLPGPMDFKGFKKSHQLMMSLYSHQGIWLGDLQPSSLLLGNRVSAGLMGFLSRCLRRQNVRINAVCGGKKYVITYQGDICYRIDSHIILYVSINSTLYYIDICVYKYIYIYMYTYIMIHTDKTQPLK